MTQVEQDIAGRRYVLFDFDGTLADSVGAITRTARGALLASGMAEEDLGDLRRLVGPPFPYAFQLVYGLTAAQAGRVTEAYRASYATLGRDAWPFFGGMVDLLGRLRSAGRHLAVCSSKRTDMIERALRDNGATDLFEVRFGKLENEESESKASVMGRVLDALGITSGDAVMVGDRHQDVEAACAHGLPCVGVTYGGAGTREELEGAGAALVVDTLDELERALLGGAR